MKWNGWLRFGIIGLAALAGCSGSSDSNPRYDTSVVTSIREGFGAAAASEDADAGASAAQPTGFATLRGTFRLEGEAPTLPTLSITKDENVCAPGGKTIYSQDVVVDAASKGIANIVLFADNVPEEWVHETAKPGKTDEIIFDQKECIFLTHVVAMQTSQKLRALNSDPVGHNLMVASFNQTIPSGGYALYEPAKEMRQPQAMRCAIHPWMQAWFINRDNSYFAVTKPDGTFEIPNLPAGVPLEIKVWQEKATWLKDVTVDGKATTWSKGKFTITLQPDEQKNMEIVINASVFQ